MLNAMFDIKTNNNLKAIIVYGVIWLISIYHLVFIYLFYLLSGATVIVKFLIREWVVLQVLKSIPTCALYIQIFKLKSKELVPSLFI